MSNILRRPMFRGGGKVSSYGTGIASGLAKPKRGLVDEPGGYAGENFLISQGLYDEFLRGKPVGTSTTTGGNILSQNIRPMQGPLLSPQMQAIQDRLNPQPKSVMGRTIGQRLLDTGGRFVGRFPALSTTGLIAAAFAPVAGLAAANAPETIEELQVMQQYGPIDEGFTEDMIKQYEADRAEARRTGTPLGTGGTGLTSSDEELQKILDSQIKKTNIAEVPQDDEFKNTIIDTEEPELTVNDYIDLLGGKQARRRDIGDMLGRASAAFLKRPARGETRGITEALGDFMETETAAGPGRREKIEQTAAMLDIKERQASKRAKEQVELFKGQEDYRDKLAAARTRGSITDQYLVAKKTESVPAAVSLAIKNTLPGYDNKEFEVVEAKDAEKRQLTESDIGKVIIRGNKSGTYTALEVIKKPDGTIDTKKIYTSL
jgi:hypothetical protein